MVHNDWVVPNSTLPAVRALWYPGESVGHLQVQVLVRDELIIEECFAGIGQGDSALSDALKTFTVTSFHVLLAALWGKSNPDEITTEEWLVSGQRFVAYIGNFGIRTFEGASASVPPGLFDRIEETIKRESLSGDLHWFHLLAGRVDNNFSFEAQKDNEHWESGVRCLEAVSWEQASQYYSVRLLIILRSR